MKKVQYKNTIKKILILLLGALILGGVSAYFLFVDTRASYNANVFREYELEPLECSLNHTKCKVRYHNTEVTFDVKPKPIQFMQKTAITISGLNTFSDDIKLHIYGLNMEMGTLIASAKKQGRDYVAQIALSSCLLKAMRYRIAVYDGVQPLGLYIDFDLED